MGMDFDTAKQRKFDAGCGAHPDSDWSTAHVDRRRQAHDELYDLGWYAELRARGDQDPHSNVAPGYLATALDKNPGRPGRMPSP
jgi:hypothetical protein